MATISEMLYKAKNGLLRMPQFQRGWVWKKHNVRALLNSLYHKFPIGSIIVWQTKGDDGQHFEGVIDGQQRLSALYSVIYGDKPPWFKDQETADATDIMFNVDTEEFSYSTKKRLINPLWINVTDVFKDPHSWFKRDSEREILLDSNLRSLYAQRIMQLASIKDRDITISKLPEDISVEDAARVFKIVNRAGTKVSEGDLVLGQLCLRWEDARELVDKKLDEWEAEGFKVSTQWVLHAMAAVLARRIEFDILLTKPAKELEDSFRYVVRAADQVFTVMRGELGLGTNPKLPINMGLVPVVYGQFRYTVETGETGVDRRFIGWWLLGTLHQRWSSDTRNRVNIDIDTIENSQSTSGLLKNLRRKSPSLRILPDHFAVKRTPSQNFYRFMLILTRKGGARDLKSGIGLSFDHIGCLAGLQTHHIFPIKLLRQRQMAANQIHQLANLAFVTQDTNLRIGTKAPSEYLPALEKAHPGVIESQWIPDKANLWEVKAYYRFLEERRKLLADAANDFLHDLLEEEL